MTVAMIGRWVAAVAGALLVLTAWASVVVTLIVARPVGNWLTRWVDRLVNVAFRLATSRMADYRRRDRILAGQAGYPPHQLAAWLGVSFVGYWLLLWPLVNGGLGRRSARRVSLFTLGYSNRQGRAGRGRVRRGVDGTGDHRAADAYLPTLYAAFNRRETEVALLNAGRDTVVGPELLARTNYALWSGISTLDTLPELYSRWERWAADVAESHTAYLPLVVPFAPAAVVVDYRAAGRAGFRGAVPRAVAHGGASGAGRLCLRSGFLCFNQIARRWVSKSRTRPTSPTRSAGST
jgi:hypothetical protein